jgi:hypothetical protein
VSPVASATLASRRSSISRSRSARMLLQRVFGLRPSARRARLSAV